MSIWKGTDRKNDLLFLEEPAGSPPVMEDIVFQLRNSVSKVKKVLIRATITRGVKLALPHIIAYPTALPSALASCKKSIGTTFRQARHWCANTSGPMATSPRRRYIALKMMERPEQASQIF